MLHLAFGFLLIAATPAYGQYSDPVPNLTLRQVNDRRVQASWTAPSNPVEDYRVFVNDANVDGNGTMVASGTTTYTTTSQFNSSSTVTIHVRATSMQYWSTTSTDAITILALLDPVVSSSVSSTSATLALTQPSAPGLPANQYTATFNSSAGPCTAIPSRSGTTSTNLAIISGLEEGILYSVSVTATNTATGLTSVTVTTLITQEAAPAGPPGVPTADAILSTNITLTWTPISCLQINGIRGITNYTILYRQGNNVDRMINTQSAARTFLILDLLPYTLYSFMVAGVNDVGTGPFSGASTIRTAEARPSEIRNLMATATLFSVEVTWLEPVPANGVIVQYIIRYAVNGSNGISLITNYSSSMMFRIVGLSPGTVVYDITVAASTTAGAGPSLTLPNPVTTLRELPKVQNVTVEFLNSTSVQVSWDRLNIPAITHYLVYYTTERQVESTIQVIATASSVVINNMTNNGIYTFQVAVQVVLEGVVMIGPRSDRNTLVVINNPSCNESNGDHIAIIPVVVFVATVVIYSIILMVLGVSCYYYRKRKHRNKFSPEVTYANKTTKETRDGPDTLELKTCEAYGQVVRERSPQPYEQPVTHAIYEYAN